MRLKKVAVALLTLTLITLHINGVIAQVGELTQEVPKDKEFRIGKLDNGLTYYIRASENPQGYAEFFIAHNVGSLQEEESQRGLAHFLEHMAFNGTKHFPEKELLDYFASIGVKFGNNINAFTSFDRTVYNISAVPVRLRSAIIDSALLALHDWSHYISCEQEEIDKERGVVREEWRRGDDGRSRMMKGINRVVQKGSRFAERDVIGLMEVIDNFSRETLIDYYHKWYRPDLQAIIITGDVDVDDIEQRIIELFSSIPKTENGAERITYTIPYHQKPTIGYITDPESKAVSVRLVVKMDNLPIEQRGTLLAIEEEVATRLFADLFKARVDATTRDNSSASRTLVPIFGESNYAAKTFTVTALPRENDNLLAAIQELMVECERLEQHGFDGEELETAKAAVRQKLVAERKKELKLKNRDWADIAVQHFTRGQPLLDLEAKHFASLEILKKMTVERLNHYIGRFIGKENRVIAFAVPDELAKNLPSEEEVYAMLEEVASEEHQPYVPATDKEISIPQLAYKRSVNAIKEYSKESGAYYWTLPNGTKVIWKEEDNNGTITMRAVKRGGFSSNLSPEELRVAENALLNLTINGLNRSELERWNTLNEVTLRSRLEYRESEISGSFKKGGEEKFFSLLYHLFTDVTIAKRDLDHIKGRIIRTIEQPSGEMTYFRDSIAAIKFKKRPMKANYTREFAEGLTIEKIEQLYKELVGNINGYTFIFTGPLSKEEGVLLTESYLAAIKGDLPAKEEKPIYKESHLRDGEANMVYKAENMLSTKASVTRFYHAPLKYNAKNSLTLRYLLNIMRERFMHSIREEKGGTYHVGVSGDMLEFPKEAIGLTIEFDTDPTLVAELLAEVDRGVLELIKTPPTEREVRDVTLYLEKGFNERARYTSLLKITDQVKGRPNIVIEEENYLGKVGAKEIHKLARKLFKAGNEKSFIFEPVIE